MVEEIGFEPM